MDLSKCYKISLDYFRSKKHLSLFEYSAKNAKISPWKLISSVQCPWYNDEVHSERDIVFRHFERLQPTGVSSMMFCNAKAMSCPS
jgi:hypothetical protein